MAKDKKRKEEEEKNAKLHYEKTEVNTMAEHGRKQAYAPGGSTKFLE